MVFSVMLAKSYDPKRIKDWSNVTIEPKLDGVRVIATVIDNEVVYRSRNGRVLDMFTHLDRELKKLRGKLSLLNAQYDDGAMFDGEMVADSAKFGDISGAIHRKNHVATYARFHCFHVMPLRLFNAGADNVSQVQRFAELARAIKSAAPDLVRYRKPVYVRDDLDVMITYKAMRAENYEGAMVKTVSEPWIGKRSYAWMKMKPEETEDVIVSSLKKGTGKYSETLGALICHRVLKGGKLGAQVQVSGMTDEQRAVWWMAPKRIVGKMIEVAFHEATEIGKLRHPRFVRIRTDKQGETSK